MGELGIVEAEQAESGGLTIRLFKRKYMLSDEGEIVKTKGEPMDVPVNSWIDVRLDMPDDSAFNHQAYQSNIDPAVHRHSIGSPCFDDLFIAQHDRRKQADSHPKPFPALLPRKYRC
ncbi:hypothetical protein ABKS15_19945 [Enterobacter cloacae]